MVNQTFDITCEEMHSYPPVEIMGFSHCWAASPQKVFTEECSHECKHGRPVSRCVYTVDPEDHFALEDSLDGCHITGLCMCRDKEMKHCDMEARFVECFRTDEALERLKTEAELAALQKSLGANASIDDKYTALEHAYDQRTAQLNDLEEEHEEVSEQLETALEELQTSRDQHRAEIASRPRFADTGENKVDQSIIAAGRLSEKLDREIKARKAKEAELRLARRKNDQLMAALAVAFLAVLGALASAVYFMKRRPRVLLVGPSGEAGGDATAVQNSTVVMGREVPASAAKATDP